MTDYCEFTDEYSESFIMDYLYSYNMDYLAELISQIENDVIRRDIIHRVGEAIDRHTLYELYQDILLDDGEHDLSDLL